jgi:hypothetical protein
MNTFHAELHVLQLKETYLQLQRKVIGGSHFSSKNCHTNLWRYAQTIEENNAIYDHLELYRPTLPPENHRIFETKMATITHLRPELGLATTSR